MRRGGNGRSTRLVRLEARAGRMNGFVSAMRPDRPIQMIVTPPALRDLRSGSTQRSALFGSGVLGEL
jgi:hypothetical protein